MPTTPSPTSDDKHVSNVQSGIINLGPLIAIPPPFTDHGPASDRQDRKRLRHRRDRAESTLADRYRSVRRRRHVSRLRRTNVGAIFWRWLQPLMRRRPRSGASSRGEIRRRGAISRCGPSWRPLSRAREREARRQRGDRATHDRAVVTSPFAHNRSGHHHQLRSRPRGILGCRRAAIRRRAVDCRTQGTAAHPRCDSAEPPLVDQTARRRAGCRYVYVYGAGI